MVYYRTFRCTDLFPPSHMGCLSNLSKWLHQYR